jgi:hypothetical protein
MTTDFTVLHEGSRLLPSRVDSEKEARCRVRYGIPILGDDCWGFDYLADSSSSISLKEMLPAVNPTVLRE